MNEIRFYKVNDEYGCFSNFAPYPIFIENEMWRTVEHYFQASKFGDEATRIKIKEMDSPMKAANEGRNKKNLIVSDWESIKDDIMHKGLLCKFCQHPKLRKMLILTGTKTLIEHTRNDRYWADGGDGSGKNMLGKLLMLVRNEIQLPSNDPELVLPPWISFPSVSRYDIFWRMGLGEDYITQWAMFYQKTDQTLYKTMFPATTEWSVIYE